MPRIRKIEIDHFRGIQHVEWYPSAGLNCLIGPGDSGKSTILDAIDFCIGTRRNLVFTDADFHMLDVDTPIIITTTLGELDDGLKNIEAYGMYLRGFDAETGAVEDEPEKHTETVLTVKLTVTSDLEPAWTLVSERAEAQSSTRDLKWSDRVRLAPTRIGVMDDYHLEWRRGSVLNRVSEERADASAALAKAARDARTAFGDQAQDELRETLDIVAATARYLGIPIGDNIKAMLDTHSVSFSGGTIGLHKENGVPLRGLGTGSTRLLIAGLHRKASAQSSIILIDELEHGLEPHRIIRLLGSLGAKEASPPLQVFMTTHSPVALRELSGDQMFVTRAHADHHDVSIIGTADDIQSTIRLYPDAFLAPSVIVCEGASEVGLVRGLDQYQTANGSTAITAQGTALIDGNGGGADRLIARATVFRKLGYRAAVIRDSDQKPTAVVEDGFLATGGTVVAWGDGRALEDELFLCLTDGAVEKLLKQAVELHGEVRINEHIKTASSDAKDLDCVRAEAATAGISPESRVVLAKAARTKKAGWFKSVTWMEDVARDIVGPDLVNANADFRDRISSIFVWARDVGQ